MCPTLRFVQRGKSFVALLHQVLVLGLPFFQILEKLPPSPFGNIECNFRITGFEGQCIFSRSSQKKELIGAANLAGNNMRK